MKSRTSGGSAARSRNPPKARSAGLAQHAERRRRVAAGEIVVAHAEQGEIVVAEPAQERGALVDLRRWQRRRAPSRRAPTSRASDLAHLRPVGNGGAHVVEHARQRLGQGAARRRATLAGDGDLHPGFADAARHAEPDELAFRVARNGDDRMDDEPNDAAAIVDRRAHRIDKKRHVVIDDLDDRARRRPAIPRRRRIVDAHPRLARRAVRREMPHARRRRPDPRSARRYRPGGACS